MQSERDSSGSIGGQWGEWRSEGVLAQGIVFCFDRKKVSTGSDVLILLGGGPIAFYAFQLESWARGGGLDLTDSRFLKSKTEVLHTDS